MRILSWCKANAVLSISLLAALITACIVPPDRDYAGYYDIKTLVCLFSVLAVVGALRGYAGILPRCRSVWYARSAPSAASAPRW